MFDTDYKRLFLIQALFTASAGMGFTMLVPYWLTNSMAPLTIALFYYLPVYALAIPLFFLLRITDAQTRLRIGWLAVIVQFFIALAAPSPLVMAALAVCWAVEMVLYWAPFNALFHRAVKPGTRGVSSALLTAIWPVSNLIFPALGGAIYQSFGFAAMTLSAAAVFALGLIPLSKLEHTAPMRFDWRKVIDSARGVRTITFLQGFWYSVTLLTVTIISLRSIHAGVEYGLYIAWLGLAAALAGVLVGKYSDKIKDRKGALTAATLFLSAAYLAATQTADFMLWSLATGFVSFFSYLAGTFMLAAYADVAKDKGLAMMSREVMMGAGNITGCLALALLLYAGAPEVAYGLAAIAAAVCPAIILHKRKSIVVR